MTRTRWILISCVISQTIIWGTNVSLPLACQHVNWKLYFAVTGVESITLGMLVWWIIYTMLMPSSVRLGKVMTIKSLFDEGILQLRIKRVKGDTAVFGVKVNRKGIPPVIFIKTAPEDPRCIVAYQHDTSIQFVVPIEKKYLDEASFNYLCRDDNAGEEWKE